MFVIDAYIWRKNIVFHMERINTNSRQTFTTGVGQRKNEIRTGYTEGSICIEFYV